MRQSCFCDFIVSAWGVSTTAADLLGLSAQLSEMLALDLRFSHDLHAKKEEHQASGNEVMADSKWEFEDKR